MVINVPPHKLLSPKHRLIRQTKLPKVKKVSYAKAKGLADKWFSLYIRLRDSDESGWARCISCFKPAYWRDLQNGHYISRSALATRYDGQNCWAQCSGCNIFKEGNRPLYTVALEERFGYGIIQELVDRSHKFTKYSTQDLLDMADKFKKDAQEIAKTRGINL